jgi:hypothetical protein
MTNQRLIAEIRYVPNPSFLDNRGTLVKKLINDDFKNWVILENNIQITNKEGNVFASYANLGFSTSNKKKLDVFINEFDEILKYLGDLPPLRWGVRIQHLVPSKVSFSSLVEKYKTNFLNFQPRHFSKINGDLVDLAVSYIFNKDRNTFHLQSGPMEKMQAEGIFEKKNLPSRGIYIDLDIYREKEKFYRDDFRRSRITEFVKSSFDEGQSITDEFEEALNGK